MVDQLRPMAESDLEFVLKWRNHEAVRNNMYTSHVISPEEHSAWWVRESVNEQSRHLIYEADDSPLGVVSFSSYTGSNGTATWAFYSGDTSKRGIGARMESLALDYAFNQLKLRRLECEVLSFNKPVVNFHRKFGFRVEGLLRQSYERDGEFFDVYKLAILKKDWEKSQENGSNRLKKTYSKNFTLTAEWVEEFAKVSGDYNRLHLDIDYAKMNGFDHTIVHGMLMGSIISSILANDYIGSGAIYISQTFNFLKPVLVGQEVSIDLKLLSQIGRCVTIETNVVVNGNLALKGEAELIIPNDGEPREA